jgi:large subunit ribosomal protein L13
MQDEQCWIDAQAAHPDAQVTYEGFLSTDDLQASIGGCRAILMTPKWVEAFGNVAIEAMACGVPVIAYRRGGPAEIVIDGETGFLVEPDDVDGVVAAVGRLGEIDRVVCRQRVDEQFSTGALAQRIDAWLDVTMSVPTARRHVGRCRTEAGSPTRIGDRRLPLWPEARIIARFPGDLAGCRRFEMRTYSPKASEITRAWHVIDADGMVLGRICTEAARVLRGKHKPTFAPHIDTGDHVVIINASKVVLTKGKAGQKNIYRHSGYPGGLKTEKYSNLLDRDAAEAVRRSVRGMLPHGPLGRQQIKKLKVYAGAEHPHAAQLPKPLEIPAAKAR